MTNATSGNVVKKKQQAKFADKSEAECNGERMEIHSHDYGSLTRKRDKTRSNKANGQPDKAVYFKTCAKINRVKLNRRNC